MSVEWLIAFTTVSGVGVSLAFYLGLRSARREPTLMREALLDAWRADWLVGDEDVAEGWRQIRHRYAVPMFGDRMRELRAAFARIRPSVNRATEKMEELGWALRAEDV